MVWNSARRVGDVAVLAAGVMLLAVTLGCVQPSPVVQGKVVEVLDSGRAIRVADELAPQAEPLLFEISAAEIGAAPVAGDEVRLAYKVRSGQNVALRVMNLTRQREVEAGGH